MRRRPPTSGDSLRRLLDDELAVLERRSGQLTGALLRRSDHPACALGRDIRAGCRQTRSPKPSTRGGDPRLAFITGQLLPVQLPEWSTCIPGLLRFADWIGTAPRMGRRMRQATIAAGHLARATARGSASIDIGLARVLRLDATTPINELASILDAFQPEWLHA